MDKIVEEIIQEIAKETNIKSSTVRKVVMHFFNWQRQSFIKLEYSSYYWRYFGKFFIIRKRYNKRLENEKNETNKQEKQELTNNKKTIDHGKDEKTK